MELNYSKIILKISNLTTVSSYLKGTFIFTLFTISERTNDDVLILGLIFVAVAFVVNLIVLLATLIGVYKANSKALKTELWRAIAFQFANVPIAIAYFYYIAIQERIF